MRAPARRAAPRSRRQSAADAARRSAPTSSGLACISQRRGVTPLVTLMKALGEEPRVVGEDRLDHQVGVQRRDAVDACARRRSPAPPCAPAARRVRRSARRAHASASSPGKRARTSSRKRVVDLVDDLQVARQQRLEQRAAARSRAPRASACGWCSDTASRVIAQASSQLHAVLVDQQAHQLGRRQRRMGVVQVDRVAPAEVVPARRASRRWRASRSCSDALTRKASCFRRSSRPAAVLSSGYSTQFSSSAPTSGPRRRRRGRRGENAAKSIGSLGAGLPLAQRRDALAVVRRHDEVEGARDHAARPAASAARVPSACTSAAEADPVAAARAAATSQGLPSRIQSSGTSTWRPSLDRAARTCRTGSAGRSRTTAGRARRTNRGSRPPAGRGRRCRARHRARARARRRASRPCAASASRTHRREAERGQRVAERAAHQELHRQVVDAARTGAGGAAVLGLRGRPARHQRLARSHRRGTHRRGGRE